MAKKPMQSRQSGETKLIKELAEILNETGLSEIEMEKDGLRLRVARAAQHQNITAAPVSASILAPAPKPQAQTAPDAKTQGAIPSPMVGTAYIRPSPDENVFVCEGDTVKKGDTLLLIEAMKTFNPIKAPQSGTIKQILVEDGQPVEFGQALLIIG